MGTCQPAQLCVEFPVVFEEHPFWLGFPAVLFPAACMHPSPFPSPSLSQAFLLAAPSLRALWSWLQWAQAPLVGKRRSCGSSAVITREKATLY